ncbi:MAG: hypothetical protein PHQ43_04305 [Dehalococcoidales bacterium]|nr:hypothetical protein [Dehalococcoidales bacterium]
MKKQIVVFVLVAVCLSVGWIIGEEAHIHDGLRLRTEYIQLPPEVIIQTEYVPSPPETIEVEKFVEVPVEKVVERTVEVEKTVEVAKWRNLYWRPWDSIDQFVAWYKNQDFKILLGVGDRAAVCSDYAILLQKRALEQGYPVSLALLDGSGMIYGVFVGPANHMGNLVVANKVAYFVEPQPGSFRIAKITAIK